MAEPILDPSYWAGRLDLALRKGHPHEAVFKCPADRWAAIEQRHREVLRLHVYQTESVLDAGCGWGRLLDMMPVNWLGRYLGVDLSPDFITRANGLYPGREFRVGDLRDLGTLANGEFDWAVLVSIRPMVVRNCGEQTWKTMEAELRRVARRLLYLEYDPNDQGVVG